MSDVLDRIEGDADRASDDYANEYPDLGFNPAPGVPANVQSLGTQVQAAANALGEADRLLAQLRASSGTAWQGAAAEAFRGKVNADLAPDLEHAQTSLTQAVGVLDWWCQDLVTNKASAAELDAEARQARANQQQADQNLQAASNDPGLALAGRTYTDPSEYLRAKATYQLAAGRLQEAETDSQNAANALDAILARAKTLKNAHFDAAERAAEQLRSCTNHLAPHKPGSSILGSIGHAFSSALGAVGGFVKSHLKQIHDVLSTISAVSGLLALCTPPPADAVFGAVALVSGAGALGIDAADPKFRKALASGDISAYVTLGGDIASVIPGAGALTKVVKEGKPLGEAFSAAAKNPGVLLNQLNKLKPVQKLGDSLSGLDHVLKLGYKGAHDFEGIDRINLLHKSQGVVSHVRTDLEDAFG